MRCKAMAETSWFVGIVYFPSVPVDRHILRIMTDLHQFLAGSWPGLFLYPTLSQASFGILAPGLGELADSPWV